jgi:hypothetical protein
MQDEGEVKGIVWAVFAPQFLCRSGKGSDSAGGGVGLVLRFALNARPTGSQGFAPGQANDQRKTEKQKPKDNLAGAQRLPTCQAQRERG